MPYIKVLLILLMTLLPFPINAQLKQVYHELKRINFLLPDSTQGWKRSGKLNLNFNQALYDSWQGGADNSIELGILLNEKFEYQSDKMIWDNYIIADYGLNKLKKQAIRKTYDKLEYNSLVGIKLPKNWSASYFLNLQTQLTNSYNYDKDLNKENRINGFLAPLYITTGPGVMWKKHDKFYFNLAPITYKMTYVNGRIHRYDSDSLTFKSNDQITILGIEPGHTSKYQLGFYASAFYEFNITPNIRVENRVSLYSDYLEDFSNIDFDYTMRMLLKINDLLKTQITIETRYDDDAYKTIQLRESLGVGITLKL
ncbi:DUF3078 domain-containing protein [Flavobacteriaceae bacterium Ap0902]|nr:DUF3078 domain-containing protein [Flavobacteriaceae bacterium Ap0902]